ncbi:MAG: LytR C-terminal domain-containing protein [Actinomycetia bacterium]|nr:LytR C-terminal domain-containing protein [Actinomycetes bacterium]
MSYDSPGRTTRPPSRSSSSAPMGSTVAIVVTAIAVLLAFFILRKVNDSGETSTIDPGGTSATTAATVPGDTSQTTIPLATTPATTSGIVKVGTSVQVINCSNQNGVARNMSNALAAEGFTMVEPDSGTIDLPVTKVIYNPDDPLALPVAQTVALLLGNVTLEASGVVPSELLGTWAPGSNVAVLLGDDLAGKTLAQIQGIETTGTTAAPTSAP